MLLSLNKIIETPGASPFGQRVRFAIPRAFW